MMPANRSAALFLVLVAGCTNQPPATQFHSLVDQWWAMELAADPLRATATGEHRWDDRLPFVSPDSLAALNHRRQAILARLEQIPKDRLDRTDRVSRDMMADDLTTSIKEFEFGTWQMPILADDGFHMSFARLPDEVPLLTTQQYDNYLRRLAAYPRLNAEYIDDMRAGIRSGFTMPAVVLDGYQHTITAHVVDDVTQSVFWRPFIKMPSTIARPDQDRLVAEGRRIIMADVVPAYRAFDSFMTKEYLPAARKTIGASELPNGKPYYQWLVQKFTTLPLTPDSVHRLGLAEVARIRTEMEAVIKETGFRGTFAQFLAFLRTDPQFYAKTPDDLIKEASWLAKTIDGRLPALFGKLPRQPYTVAPVPDDIAPKYTGGRYVGAPLDGTRPGTYWVNTYDLKSRPLYVIPALTLHEAVPGHHLQSSLAKELTDLPTFRRNTYVNAFGEGWGLYSEFLGIEAGIYRTPYTRFGRLTYEMWRACRLVVDTGIHSMGWTRDQALAFLASNTALSLHEVTTETDRYISWPGQALAYKLGELKIRALRIEAERALGPKFDVRRFHDAVLQNGTIPLTVLEDEVHRFVQEESAAKR